MTVWRKCCLCALLTFALTNAGFIGAVDGASASFGFEPNFPQADLSTGQAGAHPDLTIDFSLNRQQNGIVDGSLRTATVDLPPGLLGNPESTPRCSVGRTIDDTDPCSRATIVGYSYTTVKFPGQAGSGSVLQAPVYNVEPIPGYPASLVVVPGSFSIRLDTTVRSDGDYGIRAVAQDIADGVGVARVRVVLWGVPADHNGEGSLTASNGQSFGGRGPGDRVAFVTNPASCAGGSSANVTLLPWQPQEPSAFGSSMVGPFTGCEQVAFRPSMRVKPKLSTPGTPSGYDIDIDTPQNNDPDGLATSTLRNADVVLPPGVTISPSTADGLQACTDAEAGLGTMKQAECPGGSRVGTATITSPLLPGPIAGGVFIGQPRPGNRYRLFLTAFGYGVPVRLEGRITPDPATGQLRATFLDNPELPFSNLHVDLDGGDRAVLANPSDCGTKTATGDFTGHSGAQVGTSSDFSISCPGVSGFAPTFDAGASDSKAGSLTNFGARFTRLDDSQFFRGVSVTLPTGVLARVRGVPLCGGVAASTGTCAGASRVGTATVGAGPGSNPFTVRGPVYLGGPYRGAPYSLVTAVRAIAGPFDLGSVVVRQALYIDRKTAQVRVVSDPLPLILEGVPLRIRSVSLNLDRPNFATNPTSCAEKAVGGTFTSDYGRSASRSVRFRVGGCKDLSFDPKLHLRLGGERAAFRAGGHPTLKAILMQKGGEANLNRVSVSLPSSLALDPDNANGLCEYAESIKPDPQCPKSSEVGRARVRTPLLSTPLRGPVYFAKNIRTNSRGRQVRTLPRLIIPLRGRIAVNLIGDTSVRSGKYLVTTFRSVPDAPIGRFDLRLLGGKSGILVANTRICNVDRNQRFQALAQSGNRVDEESSIAATQCEGKR